MGASGVQDEPAQELAQLVVEADLVEGGGHEALDDVARGAAQRRRKARQLAVQAIGDMGLVAGEDLVGAGAGEANRHVLSRVPSQKEERNHGGVGE